MAKKKKGEKVKSIESEGEKSHKITTLKRNVQEKKRKCISERRA